MSSTEFCLEQSKVTDMKIADNASIDDNTHGGGEIPPCIRLTPDALPEVQQQTTTLKNLQSGVSTRNVLLGTDGLKTVTDSCLPIISFVYPHLRFYYRHTHEGARLVKEPLIVPDYQIEGLKIICASEAEDVIIVPSVIQKFQAGQTVRVIDGAFKGVIGKVARYQGQQRVAIIIDGLLTIASAYVPSAFLEKIQKSTNF